MLPVPLTYIPGSMASVGCGLLALSSDNLVTIIAAGFGAIATMYVASIPLILEMRKTRREVKEDVASVEGKVVAVHDELVVVRGEVDGKMTKLLAAKDVEVAGARIQATAEEQTAQKLREGAEAIATLAEQRRIAALTVPVASPVEVVNALPVPVVETKGK